MSYFRQPLPRTYTRLFTCPTTGSTFQAPITVRGGVRVVDAPSSEPPPVQVEINER
jgi:hypothetical protein